MGLVIDTAIPTAPVLVETPEINHFGWVKLRQQVFLQSFSSHVSAEVKPEN